MKKRNFFMQALCAGVVVLNLNPATLSADPKPPSDAVSSDANLRLLDSISTLPVPQDFDSADPATLKCVACTSNPTQCSPESPIVCNYFGTISPYTYSGVVSGIYAPISEQHFVNDLLITGHFYLPTGGNPLLGGSPYPTEFFPSFVIHDTSTGKLVETARLNFNNPLSPAVIRNPDPHLPPLHVNHTSIVGVIDTAISKESSQPFIAVTALIPELCAANIFTINPFCIPNKVFPNLANGDCCIPSPLNGPQEYYLYMYQYNPDGTLVSDSDGMILPVSYINFRDIHSSHGFIVTSFTNYTTASSFSHDGKYLFVTYLASDPTEPGPFTPVFAALAIGEDGSINTTPAFEYVMPFPPQATDPSVLGVYGVYLPLPDVVTFIPKNSSTYKLIAGFLPFEVNDVTGGHVPGSIIESFSFNPTTGTLTKTGTQALPNAVEGIDLNPVTQDRVVVTCRSVGANCTASGCLGVDQYPVRPFDYSSLNPPLTVPDANKVFRLYSFDSSATTDALTYITGHNLGTMEAFNGRWSNSGDLFLMTLTPSAINDAAFPAFAQRFPQPFPPTLFYDFGFGTSMLVTMKYNRHKDTFSFADAQPASGGTKDLAWKGDDSMVAISGVVTPNQKDLQLYQVAASANVEVKKVAVAPVINKAKAPAKQNPVLNNRKWSAPQQWNKKATQAQQNKNRKPLGN